ncbi:MAG: MucBP domain-containing protein [Liquorilactobacillus mali]|uniref:MucBP domain-containing protein n=1 Tax=Liquorilactobacillus mali TaxID=1618 RepID=UPI0039E917DB
MKFPKFIKNLLSRDSRRKYASKTVKNDVKAVTENSVSQQPLIKPENKKTVEITKKMSHTKKELQDSVLLIIYTDENGNELVTPQIVSGHLGEEINYRIKSLKNYDLINFKGFTKNYVDHYAILTLIFRKKTAGSIWIFCRDVDTNELILSPKLSKGYLGDAYQLYSPSIPEYSLLNVKGSIRGTRSLESSSLTFFYRRKNWLENGQSSLYFKMKSSVPVYDSPCGKRLKINLSPQTIWKTFAVITTADNSKWYCIGGPLWIAFNNTLMSIYAEDETNEQYGHNSKKLATLIEATVDYVADRSVNLYDRPFGKISGTLKHGTKIRLEYLETSDEVTWYRLTNKLWLPSQYILFR